jgi:carnitine O-acetyltransferase
LDRAPSGMMMLQTSIRRTLPTLTARRTLSTYKFNNLFDSNHLDLPRLPIPNLKDTLSRYESSLRPLCENEEELKNSQQAISTFLNNGGEDLHLKLCSIDEQYKSSGQFPHFYFEDLWDDGYLSARCPNPVHINPTFFMPTKPSTKSNSQEAIASEFLSASARWLVHARAGGLASDGLDMSRLGRVMGTARIPEMDTDSLQYYGDKSNHIVVQINNGEFYRVDILTADGKQALSPQAIEDALSQIKAYSANSDALKDDHPGVGVLTSLPRSDWASARSKLINTDVTGTNEKTLQTIDSALLVVSLDQLDTAGDVTEYCRANLHGVNQQTRSDKW